MLRCLKLSNFTQSSWGQYVLAPRWAEPAPSCRYAVLLSIGQTDHARRQYSSISSDVSDLVKAAVAGCSHRSQDLSALVRAWHSAMASQVSAKGSVGRSTYMEPTCP